VSPMARHTDLPRQDTAFSWLPAAPRRTGGNRICHALPSQRSASGRLTPSDGMYQPTPMQNWADGQATPWNWSAGVNGAGAAGVATAAVAAVAVPLDRHWRVPYRCP